MFSYIPEDVFCPQVSGNMNEALRVLRVELESEDPKEKPFELFLVDFENPVTQVSKTPSDEEVPWNEDRDTDTISEGKDLSNDFPAITKMDNKDLEAELGEPVESTDLTNQATTIEPSSQSDEQDETQQQKHQDEIEENPEQEAENRERDIKLAYKSMALPKSSRPQVKPELLVKDVQKFINTMKKKTITDDLNIWIIPNNMACHFHLPVDLTRLKDEHPLSYMKKYCTVTDSRKVAYKRKYEHFKQELPFISVSNLQKIYEEIYQESSLKEEILHLQRLLDVDLSMELDEETFIKLSCFMERIIQKSGRSLTPWNHKNGFEEVNFSALNGKLEGLDLPASMMTLLKYIHST